MARITLGDFGGKVAPPVGGGRVPAQAFVQDDGGLGQTAQRAAGALLSQERQEQDRIARQAESQARVDQERGRRNKMGAVFATYQVESATAAEDITARLNEGTLKRDDAQKELDTRLKDLRKQHIEPLDATSRAELDDNLIRFDGHANLSLQKGLREHAKRERAANFTTMTEAQQRLGMSDPGAATEALRTAYSGEGAAIYGADRAATLLNKDVEHVWKAHFSERLNRARGNGQGLKQLEADIVGNKMVDPDAKNILLGRIGGFQETLAARAERAAQSRERTVRAQIESTDRMILAGFEPSVDQLAALSTAAKGTAYEPVVQAQVAFANQTAKFRSMPPRAQETFLNDYERQVRANPTPDALKTLDSYQKIAKNQQELVRDDPVSFAAQKGLAEVQPINFMDQATLKDQLLARVSVARGMQAQYGAPLKILTKAEAGLLGDLMKRAGAQDKARLLGEIKSAVSDPEAYQATMQQLAPDSPATAWAGSLMGRRAMVQRNLFSADVETQGAQAAQLILRGEAMLNPTQGDKKEDGRGSAFHMPKDGDLSAGFEGTMGDAYRGREDAHRIAMQSAKAVYAALSADAGDYSGNFEGGRWKRAVELATGGTATFGGTKVVRPYGMNEHDFKNAVFTEMGTLAKSGRVGLDQRTLSRMQLESFGDAQYLVKSGTGYLLDKGGQPVVIDLMSESRLPEGFKDASGRPIVDQVPK